MVFNKHILFMFGVLLLICAGEKCLDPGFPLGGRIIATSFDDQSVVSFACDRENYSLSGRETITCRGTNWDGPVPTCIGKCYVVYLRARSFPTIEITLPVCCFVIFVD